MGLRDLFNKKPGADRKEPVANTVQTEEKSREFVLGVQDRFHVLHSDNVIVVGKVKGTVRVGDAVYVSNIGDDEGGILLTTVLGIEIGPQNKVNEATDCNVRLCLENANKQKIKCGTVVYTRNISTGDVHNAYVTALADTYVLCLAPTLTDKEIETLSIADCFEICNLFTWYLSPNENGKEETTKQFREKRERVTKAMCEKILSAESIYCVFSKVTDEPYLFSNTIDRKDGTYMCTPPDIMIIPKAYKDVLATRYSQDFFEVKEISNGTDQKGITNFLGTTFYLNGACGIRVVSEKISICADTLVPQPDLSDIPEIQRPVTNPDLERWLLLIAQLGRPDTKDKEIIYKLYCRFMQMELLKARFLVPMKHEGEIPPGNENGETVLKKDVSIKLATMDGKYDRPAVKMYTDWKRLNEGMGKDWEGFIQSIEGMINTFDCAINPTSHIEAGCYISREVFDSIKECNDK